MAIRGSKKHRSVQQEDFIAKTYEGKRSLSSGAADTDSGDVRTPLSLIECKCTGGPGGEGEHRTPVIIQRFEKIFDEAAEDGREPVLAMRWYAPKSKLANHDGWVDLVLRQPEDDAIREREMLRLLDIVNGVVNGV